MEVRMFNHLKRIRMLCTPGQRPRFDSLFVRILNRRGEGKNDARILFLVYSDHLLYVNQ